MEPPTKRPRFGPTPFDNDPYDDPDADELNERPEDVNARRDPAARLERSRAFAVFKLKSAFERIFEKYERDFTGVGDEIDLRTGEIVVDNGHIHSLKEAELGEAEGGDGGSGDGASEAGSLNEEERLLRGREDHRYSRLGGQHALPVVSVPPQIGTSPLLGGGWLGPPPLMGGSPGFTSMTYPGQMHFGSFPMQYPVPIPTPSADPTWRTPELPSPFVKNVLMLGEATPLVRKKAARLSLSAAREQDGGDEDDIFLDGFTSAKDRGEKQDLCVKQKVLVARPPPAKFSAKKSLAGAGPMKSRDAVQVGKPRKLGKASSEKQTPVRAGPRQSRDTAESGRPTGASQPQQSALRQCNPKLNPEDPNVYVNLSGAGRKLTRKPHGQALRVELPESKPPDIHSFRSLTPEPSDADLMQPHTLLDASTITKVPDPSQAVAKEAKALEIQKRAQAVPVEAFSRNFVDPVYAFSDEDEPALPRGRVSRKPSKAVKTTNIGPGALREISHNVSLQETSRQWKTTVDEPLPQGDDGLVVRAESPALSPHLDHAMNHQRSDLTEPLRQSETPRPAYPPVETPEHTHNGTTPTPGATSTADSKRGDVAEVVKPVSSKRGERGGPRKTELGTTKTPQRLSPRGRRSTGQPTIREIPETSPFVQPTVTPLPVRNAPAPAFEVQDPDPPLPSEDQTSPNSTPVSREPSPTLTDPTSRPSTAVPPSPSKPPHSSPPPRTPVKTPARRRSKSHKDSNTTEPTTTTPTPTATAKRKGILSLLPFNVNDPEEDEDELSFLTPVKPGLPPGTLRSTPAGHHVRLALSAPGSSSSRSNPFAPSSSSAAASKLKRTVLASGRKKSALGGGGSAGGAGPMTPSSTRRAAEAESLLVQTPGGTMRRCGEAGFRCEREFCFSCL